MINKIILRADGSSVIGTGHLYRQLALAEILKDDFEIIFATATPEYFPVSLRDGIQVVTLPSFNSCKPPSEKSKTEEIPFDLSGLLTGSEIVVLDGYWFGANYQKDVKQRGSKLLCIDDLAEGYFYADAVLNHAPGMSAAHYRSEPYTKFYLGLDYALLRKAFFNPFSPARRHGTLFISMGGSDSYGLTAGIAQMAAASRLFDEIHVLASPLFHPGHLAQLQTLATASGTVTLHRNLSAPQLVALLGRCSHAIASASTVLLECYSRGLACLTGYYTGNQLNIYNGFVREGRALGIGDMNKMHHDDFQKTLRELTREGSVRPLTVPLNSWKNLKRLFLSFR